MTFVRASRERYFAFVRAQAPQAFDRFLAKVDVRGPFECWPWLGAQYRGGYGRIKADGCATNAHRESHRLFHGAAGTLHVRHLCHNPICVNPGHLRSGTHRDNMHDREASGRGPDRRGASNGRALLSEEDAHYIRNSNETGAALGRKFGVSRVTACGIKRGAKWKHIN